MNMKQTYHLYKPILLLLVHFFLFQSCEQDEPAEKVSGEAFLKFYGNSFLDEGLDVKQTDDGGYLLFGTMTVEGKGKDMCLIKTDKTGNQLWIKNYGGPYDDEGDSFEILADGNIMMAGTYSDSAGYTDFYILKSNFNGNKQWSNVDEDRYAAWKEATGGNAVKTGNGLVSIGDEGFVFVGTTTAANAGNGNPEGMKDVLMVRTDQAGQVVWTQAHGGARDDISADIKANDDGFVIIGSSLSFSEPGQDKWNMFIVETNQNGIQQDKLTYGGLEDDFGEYVEVLQNGYIAAGSTRSNTNGGLDVFLVNTARNIHEINWQKNYGGPANDAGHSLVLNNQGLFIVTGYTESYGQGNADILFYEIDDTGNQIDMRTFGGEGSERGNKIIMTHDEGYVICGSSLFSENSMLTLLKIRKNAELDL
jgi:hypothetical protein